jgi:antitoxin (DNA-binding transcriptional repressor) of toxin-antitoxin stability system
MKRVRIADLKDHLSKHLRGVRRGATLVVCHRDTPIARIVPVETSDQVLLSRKPRGKTPLGRIPLPRPFPSKVNIVQLLLEDRDSGR